MSTSNLFLFKNGSICSSTEIPPITTLLESHPGAYTTTRTINNVSQLLFWDRHLRRLCNSARILLNVKPQFMFPSSIDSIPFTKKFEMLDIFDEVVCSLVNDSMSRALPVVLEEKGSGSGEELALTALVCGNIDNLARLGKVKEFNEEIIRGVFDVYVHVSGYVPPVFGVRGRGANLAVVGSRRDVANAKYSDWVRLRKPMEKLRAPSVSELLLSDNGDRILEGCLTNFFVVCIKVSSIICDQSEGEASKNLKSYELQTAPLDDGVLPGVAREVIIEFATF
ncbi:hypothetical protein Leryth_026742 [Lithospermum erythrorhizon]|nr:hypothetical protein Leryth_026742 [Lithospermum erythrorhizon]